MPSHWVDQPYPLIATKSVSHDQSHGADYAAAQMAAAHNGIIRGLNSIYIQSTEIPRGELQTVQDFLTYCQCWCESMHHHHDVEEATETFFPAIERLTGTPGLMKKNVEQHAAFTPGFDAFHKHVQKCSAAEYDGVSLRRLIEGFAEPLTQHLRDEIDTLRALKKDDSDQVRNAYNQLDGLLRKTDNYRIAPLVFGTADHTYEGGTNFPAMPFFVPYIIHFVFERKHRGVWRFNPCTSWREPRELAFRPKQ